LAEWRKVGNEQQGSARGDLEAPRPARQGAVVLTREELAFFEESGFVGGFALCPPEEMPRIQRDIEDVLGSKGFTDATAHRHLDSRIVYELCSHPRLVDRVAAILGPDLLLWHSRFFDKPPGSGAIPWHQDAHFWPIEPDTCVSAWIAIDQADSANACVEVIPGSHRTRIPHVRSSGTGRFGIRADERFLDESTKVRVELKPGEFFIFDRWLMHGSPPNESPRRRLGLSARMIPPRVRVDIEKMSPQFPELGIQIIRGRDSGGRNRIVAPPAR
jgi:hypothetical protein